MVCLTICSLVDGQSYATLNISESHVQQKSSGLYWKFCTTCIS